MTQPDSAPILSADDAREVPHDPDLTNLRERNAVSAWLLGQIQALEAIELVVYGARPSESQKV